MEKRILLLIGILFPFLLNGQFSNIPLFGIYSTDSNSAWVVGESGAIFHIVEGGAYWYDHSYDTESRLKSVCFVDEQKGFIVGESAIVLKTLDGGITWDSIDVGAASWMDFESVEFVDENYGWLSFGEYNGWGLFRTVNGGDTWEYVDTEVVHPFFVDSLNGWGSKNDLFMEADILRSYDGGLSWEIISAIPTNTYPRFFFLSDSLGFLGLPEVDDLPCHTTEDGGQNWNFSNLYLTGMSDCALHFMNETNGWVCELNYIHYSDDLFDSYESFVGEWWVYFHEITVNGYSNGWAVSSDDFWMHGQVWRLDGYNNWYLIETIGQQEHDKTREPLVDYIEIYPNPAIHFINIRNLVFDPVTSLKTSSQNTIFIYNMSGCLMEEIIIVSGQDERRVDVLTYPDGIYMAVLKNEEKILESEKFVVVKQ